NTKSIWEIFWNNRRHVAISKTQPRAIATPVHKRATGDKQHAEQPVRCGHSWRRGGWQRRRLFFDRRQRFHGHGAGDRTRPKLSALRHRTFGSIHTPSVFNTRKHSHVIVWDGILETVWFTPGRQ